MHEYVAVTSAQRDLKISSRLFTALSVSSEEEDDDDEPESKLDTPGWDGKGMRTRDGASALQLPASYLILTAFCNDWRMYEFR